MLTLIASLTFLVLPQDPLTESPTRGRVAELRKQLTDETATSAAAPSAS